eukprot:m51a1_g8264 putative endo- -beta-xylanase (783) ;mRNA; f:22733-26343
MRKSVVVALALASVASVAAADCHLSMGIRDAAARVGRIFGGEITPAQFGDQKNDELAAKNFGIITAGSQCKMGYTEPQQGRFDFKLCDAVYNFAKQHNMLFRSHNLVWHVQYAQWMKQLTTSEAKRRAIVNHINGVLAHYKGKAYAWDVVNEAVADGASNSLRNTLWYPAVPDYIDVAFKTARAADPSAKLFYNDYNADGLNSKSNYIYNMVKSMKGTRILPLSVSCMHVSAQWSPSEDSMRRNFQRFADLGLEVHVTEADAPCNNGRADWDKQAQVYARITRACLAVSRCKSLQVWGGADQYSWKGTDKTALIWDTNYNAKPAACAILNEYLAAKPVAHSSVPAEHTSSDAKPDSVPQPQPKSDSAPQPQPQPKSESVPRPTPHTVPSDELPGSTFNGVAHCGEVSPMQFSDSRNTELSAKHYGIITAGNECKMDATEPQRGHFNFQGCDAVYNWARSHNMQFRGHNLVWHNQIAQWMRRLNSAAEKKQAIIDHINGVLGHYKGKVYAWDVVNEAVSDGNTHSLRQSNWYPAVPDFIDVAFRAARAADPHAKLFYNDYGADGLGGKSDYIYNMVKGMKSRGVPIDGVGFQMHVSTQWSPSEDSMRRNFQRFAALGLDVHITEADVATSGGQGDWQKQAQVFGNMARACMAVPRCKSFQVWGSIDRTSWLGAAKTALLFDNSYNPKPAACTVESVLLSATPAAQSSSHTAHSSVPAAQSSSKATPHPKSDSAPHPQPKSESVPRPIPHTVSSDELPGSVFSGVARSGPAMVAAAAAAAVLLR